MGQGVLNSGIIAVATAVGVAIIASLAAYSMTRLDLPAPGVWLLWLLVSISLPIQLFLVPLVAWWSKLGLYDSRFCLIIIHWAVYSPFATLLIRSFLLAVPTDYIEAARLDGASEFRTVRSIVVPVVWPGILTASLIAGLLAYNEFLLAVTFIQGGERAPVSLALYSFQSAFTTNYAVVSAAGLLMALPIIAVFLALQRRFIDGYAFGGLAN
jgi:raffinose/stachyose/melibiose transport system permease protein